MSAARSVFDPDLKPVRPNELVEAVRDALAADQAFLMTNAVLSGNDVHAHCEPAGQGTVQRRVLVRARRTISPVPSGHSGTQAVTLQVLVRTGPSLYGNESRQDYAALADFHADAHEAVSTALAGLAPVLEHAGVAVRLRRTGEPTDVVWNDTAGAHETLALYGATLSPAALFPA